MRILFLAHRLPYPPNKGDKIRSYHFVRHLARTHEVHIACPIDDPRDLEHVATLRGMVASVTHAPNHGLGTQLRRFLSIPRGLPVSVGNFHCSDLQRRIDALLAERQFDCVFAYSSPMAEYLFRSTQREAGGRIRRVIDFIDVDSAKWADYAARSGGWRSWLYRREALLLAEYESRISREFDAVLLVSALERRVLPTEVARDVVHVVPNGVDLDYFSASAPSGAVPPRIVFTGVMDYLPNVEGVIWFVREIWPLIRARHPTAQFDIVGSRPTPAVRLLASHDGVHVAGFVPDVRSYLSEARVCVAPLLIARGIQNKVLEAMATARPVVCTPQAAEGLDAVRGEHLLVAEDARTFAHNVATLLQSPAEADRVGAAARAWVEEHHPWSRALATLEGILQ